MDRETSAEEQGRMGLQIGRALSPLRLAWMAGALTFLVGTLGISPFISQQLGGWAWAGLCLAGGVGALWGITASEMLSRPAWRTAGLYGLTEEEDDSDLLTFFAGWFLLLGEIALAGLLARSAAVYLREALVYLDVPRSLPILFLAAMVLFLAILENVMGTDRSRTITCRLAGLLLGLLALTFLLGLPRSDLSRIVPAGAPPFLAWLSSLALTAPIAIGLELALQARTEVHQNTSPLRIPLTLFPLIAMLVTGILLAGHIMQGGTLRTTAEPAWVGTWLAAGWGGPAGALGHGLAALSLAFALSTLILLAQGCIQPMVRDGFLPAFSDKAPVNRQGGWMILFGAFALGSAAFPPSVLLPLSAGGFLVVMALVGIRSASMPRTAFSAPLPFHPLLPAISVLVSVFLLTNVPPQGFIGMAAWAGFGALLFLLYGREAHIKAKEGKHIFTSRQDLRPPAKPEGSFRVLVPVIGGSVRRLQIQIAQALARRRGGDVLALNVVERSEQIGWEEGRRLAQEQSQLLAWSVPAEEEPAGVSIYPMTRLARDAAWGILETAREEKCDLIILGWKGTKGSEASRLGRVIDTVVQRAQCDVLVVKGAEMESIGSILVPTAGGPHAPLAAELALELAEVHDGQVTLLNITGPAPTEEDIAKAEQLLTSTVEGLSESERLKYKVIPLEGSIAETLLAESRRGYDLLLLGSTEVGVLDQMVFGNVPEQVAEAANIPVVLAKRYLGAARYWVFQAWNMLDRIIPDLAMEEQVELYRHLREDAGPGVNYFTLIVLSSIIATLGLLQNSAAVIIGAMLVAPFMTPIMAISMALVRGDLRLLSLSVESVLKGVLASLTLSILLTWIVPQPAVGSEILARTHPSMLDLVVALASGAAGAYALGRKEVAAALPGVAIAAALMPPLCAAGIGLALGRGAIAGGALLLFLANLIAIAVAGVVTFLLLGIRPPRARDHRLRRAFFVSLLLLIAVSIPLVLILHNSVRQSQMESAVRAATLAQIARWESEAELVDVSIHLGERPPSLELYLQSVEGVSDEEFEALAGDVRALLGPDVQVTLRVIPMIIFHAGAPPPPP